MATNTMLTVMETRLAIVQKASRSLRRGRGGLLSTGCTAGTAAVASKGEAGTEGLTPFPRGKRTRMVSSRLALALRILLNLLGSFGSGVGVDIQPPNYRFSHR